MSRGVRRQPISLEGNLVGIGNELGPKTQRIQRVIFIYEFLSRAPIKTITYGLFAFFFLGDWRDARRASAALASRFAHRRLYRLLSLVVGRAFATAKTGDALVSSRPGTAERELRLAPVAHQSRRRNQLHCRKVAAVARHVSRKDWQVGHGGVRANVEVRQDTLLRALPAPSIREKCLAREE